MCARQSPSTQECMMLKGIIIQVFVWNWCNTWQGSIDEIISKQVRGDIQLHQLWKWVGNILSVNGRSAVDVLLHYDHCHIIIIHIIIIITIILLCNQRQEHCWMHVFSYW